MRVSIRIPDCSTRTPFTVINLPVTDLAPFKPGFRYQGIENKYPQLNARRSCRAYRSHRSADGEAKMARAIEGLSSRIAILATAADCCSMAATPANSLRWMQTPVKPVWSFPDRLRRQQHAGHMDA
jgi:hypothetical protein